MTTNMNTPNLTTELSKLFDKYQVGKGQQYTNTSIGNPKISLNIPENEYCDFLELYTKCQNSGMELHLTEKPREVSPLHIDLDFRFDSTGVTPEVIPHKYTLQNVKDIVKEYFNILNTYFEVEPKQLKVYVQEKQCASLYRSKIKDGVHLLFPHLLMSKEMQHFVRSKMLKSTVFEGMQLSNKIEEVVDKAIIDSNCWLLYGSKKIESESYKVTHLFTFNKETNNITKLRLQDDIDYVKLFAMRNKQTDPNVITTSDEFDAFVKDFNSKKLCTSQAKSNSVLDISYTSQDELQLAKSLVQCLSESRAENYNDWINLGFALYNISSNLLDTWEQFSEKGSSYKSGECIKLWGKMKNKGLTMGSLKHWAKLDNPDMYAKIIENTILSTLDICMRSDGTHGDISDVIAKYMKDKIIYDTKARSWFYVDETNKWKTDSEGSFIYKLCKTTICTLFCERSLYWTKMGQQSQDENQADMYHNNGKKMLDIALKLKNTTYVKHIIPQLKSIMSVDDFVESCLDSNIDILAFENCVYDLKLCTFRNIEPTDYISITTGYNYNEKVDDQIVEEVTEIIKSMFTSEEMYGYVLDIITSLLLGKNLFQEFYIMTGTGSNGKSMLMNTIGQGFGGYAKKLNANTFTKPSRSANETSELYNCKGVRFIYTEEPDTDDKLITSRLKELSGDSTIKTRGLYSHPIEYLPQFKIMICCNDIPRLSKVDGGIARRLRVIQFKYKFVDNPDEKNPYHKEIDRSINSKFADDDRYKQAFAKIICDNWAQNVKQMSSMCTPKEVTEASKSFVEECNEVLVYVTENYEITGNPDDTIPSRDLFNFFKCDTHNKTIDEKTFSDRLNDMGIPKKIMGKAKKSFRIGIKKIDEQEEE